MLVLKVASVLCVSFGCESQKAKEWREAWELSQSGEGRSHVVIYNLRETDGPATVVLATGREERLLGEVNFYPIGIGKMSFAIEVTRALMDMDRPPSNPQIYVYDKNKIKPLYDGFVLRIDK